MYKKISLLFFFILSFFLAFSQELSIQTGHSASILALKFTHDNRYLISAGADNKVIIWDMATMKQMRLLTGHLKKVNDIEMCPGKKQFATASDDGTVKFWSFPDGKLIKSYDFYVPIKAIAFSPKCKIMAVASDSIFIFNLTNKKKSSLPFKARKYFTTVAFSKNGNYIALGGKNEYHSFVYELTYNRIVNKFRAQSNKLLFSTDDKFIYSAGDNGNLKIKPLIKKSSKKHYALLSNNSWDAFTDIVETKKYIIASNSDKLIYIYDKQTKKRIAILKGQQKEPLALAVSSDGKYLATAGKDREILLWNLQTFKLSNILKGGANSITSLSFSKNGNFMFLTYNDGSSRIWNLGNKGQMLFLPSPKINFFQKYFNNEYSAQNSFYSINPQKDFIINSLEKIDRKNDNIDKKRNQIFIWDIQNYGNIHKIKNNRASDYRKFFITDTSRFIEVEYKATHSQKYSLINHEPIIDRQTVYSADVNSYFFNKPIKKENIKPKKLYKKYDFTIHGDIYFTNVSPDGEFLMDFKNTKNGRICDLWDIQIADKISTLVLDKDADFGGFSPSGNYFFISYSKTNTIKIYELNTQKLIDSLHGIIPFVFADNDEYCAFTDKQKNLHVFDFKRNKKLFSVQTGHQSSISAIKFNLKHKFIATASTDGLVKLWSSKNGQALVSLAAFNKDDFIYVSPDNYYYTTKGAMKYIGFILKNTLYTFDQFDVLYNRPDTVLSRLDFTPKSEIALFKKAYQKRLKKMGFTSQFEAENFNIPKVKIQNLANLPFTTDSNCIYVNVLASDSLYNLDRINIWVNGVPQFGTEGFSIKNIHRKKYQNIFKVILNSGKNKIDIAAYNIYGAQSLKKTFTIILNKKQKPNLYLVVIGISDYENKAYRLHYAAKDASDIAALFDKSKNFNKIYITKILNKDATRENILGVKKQLLKTNVNDEVILFYAGHGFLDEDYDYYLTCEDLNYYKFFQTTIEYNEFVGILDSIPARKKVVFIDACHSGEVDTDNTDKPNTKLVNVNQTFKGESNRSLWFSKFGDRPQLGSQNSFELMKIMFADLRIGSGSTIISSAGGQEYAYESAKIKNGVFTYVLLNGIKSKKADLNKDGKIMLSELQDYVMKTVTQLTKGRQNPTNRRQNIDSDFVIWQ